jgi:hypothetical protein
MGNRLRGSYDMFAISLFIDVHPILRKSRPEKGMF